MGLVDLKTDLKSLKYGRDRPGGGSSNQPYIVTPIPDGLTPNSPDFLLRQGALKASLNDVSRLTKWFSDPLSVNGLLFTAKQNLLERQNPAVPGGLNRIYLPTSTLSQALLSPEGFHLNKQGLDPFELSYAQGGTSGYFNYTLNKDTLENVSRLSLLYSTKIAKSPLTPLRTAQEKEFNISSNSEFSLSYSGGPNSVGGLGRTNIRIQNPTVRSYINPDGSNPVYTFKYEDLAKQVQKRSIGLYGLTDYRATINQSVGEQVLPATLYEEFNREKTYNTSPTYYKVHDKKALLEPNNSISPDLVNLTNPLPKGNIPEFLFESDLVKFFFEVINPKVVDKTNDISSEFLFFRAYLNSIGDGFKAEWQPYKYVGRAENFYRYSGFSRDVQLSFIIYAHSRDEMIPLYKKLNKLLGATAPTYGESGYMLGNFVKLTVGTYFNSVPGIINSITLKPSFEAGWDINRDVTGNPIKTEDKTYYVGQIPRMIEIDMTFTPIHDFTPQSTSTFINNTPTIQTTLTPPPSSTPNTVDEPIQPPFELSQNNFVNFDTAPPSTPSITGDLFPGAIEV